MIGIIDTSSLVAIARYYLSIRDEAKLLYFIESKFRTGELVLLKSIHCETSYTQKGIAVSLMKFLNDSELIVNDDNLLPPSPKRFSNQIDNSFCKTILKKQLSDEEFIQQKNAYLKTGDAKMILYALNNKDSNQVIITEETHYGNDGKLFKKLPAICDILEIKHQTIAEWLSLNGVEISWTLPNI